MRKLIAKDLKIKFIETLNELEGFSYEEGNPFLIKIMRERKHRNEHHGNSHNDHHHKTT